MALAETDARGLSFRPLAVSYAEASGAQRDLLRSILVDAGLPGLEDSAEMWTISQSTKELSYLSHGSFRFYGKFPPPIASELIERYSHPGDTIVDSMVGSGTTLLEAVLRERRAIGIDPNPFCCLLSKVKVTPLAAGLLRSAQDSLIEEYPGVVADRSTWEPLIPKMRGMDHWFFEPTQRELAAIRRCIEIVADSCGIDVANLFRVAFASIVRPVSRAGSATGRQFLDKTARHEPVLPVFLKRLDQLIRMNQELGHATSPAAEVRVVQADARSELGLEGIGDLVISHPPYFNLYNFASIYRFEIAWLGYDYSQVRQGEVRDGFKMAKTELLPGYLEDMRKVMETNRHLARHDGKVCVMMGDAIIHGSRVQVVRPFIQASERLGFQLERIALREPRFTEATWATALRRSRDDLGVKLFDFVMVFSDGGSC